MAGLLRQLPGGYPYGDYYGDYYYGGYPSYADYGYAESPNVNVYTAGGGASTNEATQASNEKPAQSEYYTEALSAFRGGEYTNAIRLASHAMIDQPRDQNVHLLLMLSFFATGQYRPAAMEAHAVASLARFPTGRRSTAFMATWTLIRPSFAPWRSSPSRRLLRRRADSSWVSSTRSTGIRGRPSRSFSRR